MSRDYPRIAEYSLYHKTDDKGVDSYDTDEGLVHEVELRGGFLAASFPHPKQ
jgi:hypothetical protein